MRLLFITQKLHGQDAFVRLWVREFARQGFAVTVVCLESDPETVRSIREIPGVRLFSLGKEHGSSRCRWIVRFTYLVMTIRTDRVFVHMAPVYYALGCWWWILFRIPTYLWYTHYQMQLGVWLFGWFGKRFFCATSQSLPQYEGSAQKIVVGHGIDRSVWARRDNTCIDPHRLLIVHRLSRSKRLELSLRALSHLPRTFMIDVYGIEAEPDYVREIHALVVSLGLGDRVQFHGTVPMQDLPDIYTKHRVILNMASETIDKTMLEAMTCGCYPVTTAANAQAIGLPAAPKNDTPEAIAAFVERAAAEPPIDARTLDRIVSERHSLDGLVRRMGAYIRSGT